MWPVILELGPVKLYSFGLMAALALLGGSFLLKLEMDRRGLGEGRWNSYAMTAVIGGFVGAKANFLITHPGLLKEDLLGSVFSGAGLVWYGGFIGGVIGGILIARHYRHPLGVAADCFAPALALAYMIGRMGCFLSGDGDYGPPSDLPWAMAFPEGVVSTSVPVHPTPLYEILMMAPVVLILWMNRKRPWAPWSLWGLYLILAGTERFLSEFWRLNEEGWLGMTTPQQISVVIVAIGIVLFARRHRGQAADRTGRASRDTGHRARSANT